MVDPSYKTFTVLERAERSYTIVLVATPGDNVRAVPFDLAEIAVSDLFIDEGPET